MPNENRLAEIAARNAAATKGPWEPCEEYGPNFYAFQQGEYLAGVGDFNFGDGAQADADREFMIHAAADVSWLLARVAELEAAQTSFLLPWAHQLDAKSLDNFTIDLARAADAPLLFVVDEIHQTVAQWRELVARKAAKAGASDGH